ncbi:MAG: hypothetical protein EBU84_16990, partial [Actinobacteria bacterium]|nr:hypothetical protein [Actinomycetota bacterium]
HAIALFDEEGRIVNFRGGSLTIGDAHAGDQFRVGVALHGDTYPNPFPNSATYKLHEDRDPFTLHGQTHIDDGGDDAYDGGNYLSTGAIDRPLPYLSDTQTGVFGENSEHLMVYRDGVFGTLVTGNSNQDFRVTGNLGADGGGVEDLIVLTEHNGFSAVAQRTFNAYGDPSINRIFVYESNPDVLIKPLDGYTDSDDFEISGLNGVDTFAYFAVYGPTDAPFAQESLQAFFERMVDDVLGTSLSVSEMRDEFYQRVDEIVSVFPLPSNQDYQYQLSATNGVIEPQDVVGASRYNITIDPDSVVGPLSYADAEFLARTDNWEDINYSISDSYSSLAGHWNIAVLDEATRVHIDNVPFNQAVTLFQELASKTDYSYNLNLSTLPGPDGDGVYGPFTALQARVIAGSEFPGRYEVEDSAVNIIDNDNLQAVAGAEHLVITDASGLPGSLTVAQAALLSGADSGYIVPSPPLGQGNPLPFEIRDTAEHILNGFFDGDATRLAIFDATKVVAVGGEPITVAQAKDLLTVNGFDLQSSAYFVKDSFTNLLDGELIADVVSKAASVTVLGEFNAAQYAQLALSNPFINNPAAPSVALIEDSGIADDHI